MIDIQAGDHHIELEEKRGQLFKDGEPLDIGIDHEKLQLFQVTFGSESYQLYVHHVNIEKREVDIEINGKREIVRIYSKMEKLLKQLGMENALEKKMDKLTAPMPGLIKQIYVQQGDTVAVGDSLLILEAMKMENIIKSPGAGIVQDIPVNENMTVEKDALLITFKE